MDTLSSPGDPISWGHNKASSWSIPSNSQVRNYFPSSHDEQRAAHCGHRTAFTVSQEGISQMFSWAPASTTDAHVPLFCASKSMLPITFRSESVPSSPSALLSFAGGQSKLEVGASRKDRLPNKSSIKYHGAGPLLNEVRAIIGSTAIGERRLMSAGIMVKLLKARGSLFRFHHRVTI